MMLQTLISTAHSTDTAMEIWSLGQYSAYEKNKSSKG